jgi:malate dehydrogenase
MGITLDAGRFANLISKELNIPVTDIEPCVIGSHGEGMLPLARFTYVKGEPLSTFVDDKTAKELARRTKERGQEIVSFLGSGSAYFAPSLAIKELVRCIVKDTKEVLGVSTYLDGEYGVKGVCIGVPCSVGRQGVEKIVGLDLNKEEKEALVNSAESLRLQINTLTL